MKTKFIVIPILILAIISSVIIPNIIYGVQEANAISAKENAVKAGEAINVFIDLSDVSFELGKVIIYTDVYLEGLMDVPEGSAVSQQSNKEFIITNINTDSIYVTYIVPKYIVNGTKINITGKIFDEEENKQIESNFTITITSDEQTKPEENVNNQENNQNNNKNDNLNGGTGTTTDKTGGLNNNQSNYTGSIGSSGSTNVSGYTGLSSEETAVYNGSRNNYLKSIKVNRI